MNNSLRTGTHGIHFWLTARKPTVVLSDLLPTLSPFISGRRVLVTSFDSSPLTPTPQELSSGWSRTSAGAFSPPFHPELVIPAEGFDEWIVIDDPSAWSVAPEVFINWGGFTVDPGDIEKPGSKAGSFWAQYPRLPAFAYVACGDRLNVVSASPSLVRAVEKTVREHGSA